MWYRQIFIALVASAGLVGCSAFDRTAAHLSPAEVSEAIDDIEATQQVPRYSVLRIDDARPYTGLDVLLEPVAELPLRLLTHDAVSLSLAGSTNDAALAGLVEAATGIPVRFAGSRPAEAPADTFRPVDTTLPEGGIWTGALDALLDAWTTARGYAWRYLPDETAPGGHSVPGGRVPAECTGGRAERVRHHLDQ